MEVLTYLREFNFVSVLVRLVLALAVGGIIGVERVRKHRPAGLRTHMLVCIGAALAMILSQYTYIMMDTSWIELSERLNIQTDVTRFAAQVINGIGFLGVGTILISGRFHQVKGLTTAAGLWVSAIMGIVIGAGFYECVMVSFVLFIITTRWLPSIEGLLIRRSRDMMVYIEFRDMKNIHEILNGVKNCGVQIKSVEVEHGTDQINELPNLVLSLRLPLKVSHEEVISDITNTGAVRFIKEI